MVVWHQGIPNRPQRRRAKEGVLPGASFPSWLMLVWYHGTVPPYHNPTSIRTITTNERHTLPISYHHPSIHPSHTSSLWRHGTAHDSPQQAAAHLQKERFERRHIRRNFLLFLIIHGTTVTTAAAAVVATSIWWERRVTVGRGTVGHVKGIGWGWVVVQFLQRQLQELE